MCGCVWHNTAAFTRFDGEQPLGDNFWDDGFKAVSASGAAQGAEPLLSTRIVDVGTKDVAVMWQDSREFRFIQV